MSFMVDKLPLWAAVLFALAGLLLGLGIGVILASIKGSSGEG